MKVAICYVFPQINFPKYAEAARRFSDTYLNNPPGETDHDIHVCLNGGCGHGPYQEKCFSPIGVNFFEHSNWGKDIGAFQVAADTIPCDLLVCFGSHIYFHRAGWLDRMVQVFLENGPTLYGSWGFHVPTPHLRTTGFWLPPDLLRLYPYQVSDQTRYAFEHGGESITLWSQKMGFDPLLVTWDRVMKMNEWTHPSQSQCLFRDQWSDGRG